MTDNERLIALKAGAVGYLLASGVGIFSIVYFDRQHQRKIKTVESAAAMLNDFANFVHEKPVEMSGEDFINEAIERLNFIGIAVNDMNDDGES